MIADKNREKAFVVLASLLKYVPTHRDYNLRFFREDLLAGLTVAVVALPLALAFGVTSGAGAAAGLFTAIVAGVIAAAFGGSNFQVSGPTGAMTVVLLPIIARYGVETVLLVGMLAGFILLLFAFARIGRYVNYIPWPVVTGFTNGIAAIIFLQQLPGLLGVVKGEGEGILPVSWRTVETYLASPTLAPPVLGLLTVVVMTLWTRPKKLNVVPASMAALVVVTLVSLLPVFADVPRIGAIPTGLPSPVLPTVPWNELTDVMRAALAIAVLAALESLLSAVVADGMTIGERHDPNRELFGQGLANIGAALFGGIPATAALARTAVNVRSGARTRLAAIIHGVTLLLIIMFLAPLASRIPLAVLAGILMVVAVRMVEREAFSVIVRSTKSDAFVLALTMGVTILFDLILAIEVGLVAAGVLFIIRMSRMFSIDPESMSGLPRSAQHEGAEAMLQEEALMKKHILAYRIEGPIFFGAANRFFGQLLKVDGEIKIVILRMSRVPIMDATGVSALQALVENLSRRGILVFFSGLVDQPERLLERTGILDEISRARHHVFDTTDDAIAHAISHLQQTDHTKPTLKDQAGQGPDDAVAPQAETPD